MKPEEYDEYDFKDRPRSRRDRLIDEMTDQKRDRRGFKSKWKSKPRGFKHRRDKDCDKT